MSERQTALEIDEEAMAWVARIDRGLDETERHALDAWLAGDLRSRGALLRAEAAWGMLDRLRALSGGSGGDNRNTASMSHEETIADEPPIGMGEADQGSSHTESNGWHYGRRALVAASIALVALASVGMELLHTEYRQFEAGVGEVRRVPLADGSVAAINTASAVEVAITDRVRDVRLKRGEAWFEVAKDRSRPFIVSVGDIRVRAVGTAFSVRRLRGGAEVQVTDGVIDVWRIGGRERQVRLAAGSRIVANNAEGIIAAVKAPVEIDRRLAWMWGEIVLDDTPIEEAAAEFNRYNAIKIVVEGPLGRQRLIGRFRTNDPEGFVRAVTLGFDARSQTGPNTIRLVGQPE